MLLQRNTDSLYVKDAPTFVPQGELLATGIWDKVKRRMQTTRIHQVKAHFPTSLE